MVSALKYLIPFALGVVLTLLLARSCTPVDPDSSFIDSLEVVNRTLELKFKQQQAQDSAIRIREQQRADSLVTIVRAREARIAILKAHPIVKEVRTEFPVVDTLILEQDTTVAILQAEVDTLKQERARADVRHKGQVETVLQEKNNLEGINKSLEAFNAHHRRTIKWQRAELWIWRGVAAGGILYGVSKN